MALVLSAPAKINLFLHITGPRADGYHNLQTLFQLLDYGDTLRIEEVAGPAIVLTPEHPDIPPAANLIYRAALALQVATGCRRGAAIHLDKRLPLGAGLGGGSSDAATALLGLNQLWQLDLTITELAALGVGLGADVPVFVHGRTAWAEGVGDELTPVDLPPRWYLILVPGCQVATAEVFRHPELTRNALPIRIRAFLAGGAGNACQAVVEKLYPEVRAARQWLARFGAAQMTGTGSCLFAGFDDEDQARAVLAAVPQQWRAFVARGVNRSPLHPELAASAED